MAKIYLSRVSLTLTDPVETVRHNPDTSLANPQRKEQAIIGSHEEMQECLRMEKLVNYESL